MKTEEISRGVAAEVSASSAKSRAQRGGARLRTLVVVALIAAFIFICFKVIPPYFAKYQLEDWLHTQIPFFLVNHLSDDALRAAVLKEVEAEGIPATAENIKILQNNPRGVNVMVDYTVTVDLAVYELHLHFTPSMNNQSLVQ